MTSYVYSCVSLVSSPAPPSSCRDDQGLDMKMSICLRSVWISHADKRAEKRKGTWVGNLTREGRGRNLCDVFKRDHGLRERGFMLGSRSYRWTHTHTPHPLATSHCLRFLYVPCGFTASRLCCSLGPFLPHPPDTPGRPPPLGGHP